jgi:hypothetical protein
MYWEGMIGLSSLRAGSEGNSEGRSPSAGLSVTAPDGVLEKSMPGSAKGRGSGTRLSVVKGNVRGAGGIRKD